jgi:phenylpropionate dioxygenase-like ring-hydroxylating dioxygenase large terminal subunit
MKAIESDRQSLHERYPYLGTAPVPIDPYISADYFEREKRHIFKKVWQHVGRVEEMPNPGDFIQVDLPASDASVIVTRDTGGELHAMHNVCSHRMNKVVYESRGTARKLYCKFHGWSYNLDGSLSGIPSEHSFFDLDRKACALTPVAVDAWEGFIFVNVDPKPSMKLSEYLGPMYAQLEGYPFHKLTACYSWQTVVRANWKLAIDAFQETYHVAFVHGPSIASALRRDKGGSITPIDGLCDDFHRRLSIAGNPKSVYGNPKAIMENATGAAPAAGQRPIAAAALRLGRNGMKTTFDPSDYPAGLNWTGDPDWAFDINVVFPDFYLSLRPNYMQAYNFRPISHNETLFDARVYYPEMTTAGGRFYQEYMKIALRDVLLEDLSTLEHTQSACETRAKSHMQLQEHEIMVRHNAWVVDRMIREGEAAPS